MRYAKYWTFQGTNWARLDHVTAKVAQQEIKELTDLAAGLLAFEKTYTATHGERTPVFRLLSMINEKISENQGIIEHFLIHGDPKDPIDDVKLPSGESASSIPW